MRAIKEKPQDDKALSLLQMLGSVMAAVAGIQNSKNRERDFRHGKASTFIVIGIACTLMLIGAIYLAVRLALSQAGA